MKLFVTILLTLTMTLANGHKLLKNGVVTGEAWLHYERSGLLNKVLAKRFPERHVVAAQRIQNKNVQQLRAVIAELLKGKPDSKPKQKLGRKQIQQNKRKNRFNRFKKFHN